MALSRLCPSIEPTYYYLGFNGSAVDAVAAQVVVVPSFSARPALFAFHQLLGLLFQLHADASHGRIVQRNLRVHPNFNILQLLGPP
jgi:hypothetical protein